MDLKLQEITVPAFLWYILPGLNFVFAIFLLPLVLVDPRGIAVLNSVGSVVGLLLVALVLGFVMDSLKLYRFDAGYSTKRRAFVVQISEALGVPFERMGVLSEALRMGAAEQGALGRAVAFNHSRWVMMSHSARCAIGFSVVWFFVAVVSLAHNESPAITAWSSLLLLEVLTHALLIAAGIWLARRLGRLGAEQREVSNELYLELARRHRSELRSVLLGSASGSGEVDLAERLSALDTIAGLKTTARAGWGEHGLSSCESVADHSFQLCVAAYTLAPAAGVDRDRALALALVHDLPESVVGDMTPSDPRRSEKERLESEAMQELASRLGQPDLFALWNEYERRDSPEARFVWELDKLEAAMQAKRYAGAPGAEGLDEFLDSAREQVTSDFARKILRQVEIKDGSR